VTFYCRNGEGQHQERTRLQGRHRPHVAKSFSGGSSLAFRRGSVGFMEFQNVVTHSLSGFFHPFHPVDFIGHAIHHTQRLYRSILLIICILRQLYRSLFTYRMHPIASIDLKGFLTHDR
jgi:hypothetical protein